MRHSVPSQQAYQSLRRIFHHGLDAVLPENHDPLHRATVITDGVQHVLQTTNMFRYLDVLTNADF